jgi:hypothetical protein
MQPILPTVTPSNELCNNTVYQTRRFMNNERNVRVPSTSYQTQYIPQNYNHQRQHYQGSFYFKYPIAQRHISNVAVRQPYMQQSANVQQIAESNTVAHADCINAAQCCSQCFASFSTPQYKQQSKAVIAKPPQTSPNNSTCVQLPMERSSQPVDATSLQIFNALYLY